MTDIVQITPTSPTQIIVGQGQGGAVGPAGPQGLQGVAGPQGIAGPVGATGPTGVVVSTTAPSTSQIWADPNDVTYTTVIDGGSA